MILLWYGDFLACLVPGEVMNTPFQGGQPFTPNMLFERIDHFFLFFNLRKVLNFLFQGSSDQNDLIPVFIRRGNFSLTGPLVFAISALSFRRSRFGALVSAQGTSRKFFNASVSLLIIKRSD